MIGNRNPVLRILFYGFLYKKAYGARHAAQGRERQSDVHYPYAVRRVPFAVPQNIECIGPNDTGKDNL